jgi:hypothetical protein
MKKALSLIVGGLLATLVLSVGDVAYAVSPIGLYSGSGSLTYNGLQYTITSCVLQEGVASTQHSCGASDDLFLAPTSGPGSSVIIEALNNGVQVPIMTATACGSSCPPGTVYDLNVSFTVTSTGSGTISQAELGVFGSTTDTHSSNPNEEVTGGEQVATTGFPVTTLASMTAYLSNPASATFASQTSVNVSKDLGLLVAGAVNGSVLTLNYVTQSFLPASAPEPASIATLLMGLIGLGAIRRKPAVG